MKGRNVLAAEYLGPATLNGYGRKAVTDMLNGVIKPEQVIRLFLNDADREAAEQLNRKFGSTIKIEVSQDCVRESGWCFSWNDQIFEVLPACFVR